MTHMAAPSGEFDIALKVDVSSRLDREAIIAPLAADGAKRRGWSHHHVAWIEVGSRASEFSISVTARVVGGP